MDLNSLRIQVFEKTGIRIDTSDPIFALVALNDAVLSECVEQHIAALQGNTLRLAQQTAQLIEAGERTKKLLLQLGQVVKDTGNAETTPQMPTPAPQEPGMPWRWIAATGAASILSAVLVLLGQAALGHPRASAPAPSPAAQLATPPVAPVATPAAAPTLTGEQIQLIQNGEKYARMWPKLDPKTQERIKALSQ